MVFGGLMDLVVETDWFSYLLGALSDVLMGINLVFVVFVGLVVWGFDGWGRVVQIF